MDVCRTRDAEPHHACAALSGAADLDGRQLTGTQASDAALELARSHDWRAIQTHNDIPAKELRLRQGKATPIACTRKRCKQLCVGEERGQQCQKGVSE